MVNAVVPEEGKQKLEQVLTEEEYRQVTAGGKFEDPVQTAGTSWITVNTSDHSEYNREKER